MSASRRFRRQPPRSSRRDFFRPRGEQLEGRQLLTTTVFLDFGEAFVGHPLLVPSHLVDEPLVPFPLVDEQFGDVGIQGPDLNESTDGSIALDSAQMIEIKSLQELVADVGWDYDREGGLGTTDDYQLLKADVVSLVRRQFAPFDVDVQVAAATGFEEIRAALNANHGDPSGEYDAYVLVAPMFLVQANGVPLDADHDGRPDSVGQFMRLWGQASSDDLNDVCIDCIYDKNDQDESAIVFAEAIVGQLGPSVQAVVELANTASHEAAHTFGLFHTTGSFDVMSTTNRIPGVRRVFSHYPVAVPEDFPPCYLVGVCHLNSWDWLREDDDIGLRPGFREFVTGTGSDNTIAIEPEGSHGRVRIFDIVGGQEYERFSYPISLDQGILVEAGPGDDWVRIDPSLNAQVTILGGPGRTSVSLTGDSSMELRILPNPGILGTIDGLASQSGTIQAGGTTITFGEFELGSKVVALNFGEVVLETAAGADDLLIDGNSLTRLNSSSPGLDLQWFNIGELTIDAGVRDVSPEVDRFTFEGEWPAFRYSQPEIPFPIHLLTGMGDDRIRILAGLTARHLDTTGAVQWDAGEGDDELQAFGSTHYTLSHDRLSFDDGSVSFDSALENALLRGTDEEDSFVVNQFSGSAGLDGLLGTDQAIITGFENAVVGNDSWLNPQIIADNAIVTLVDVYNLTLEDLAWRTNNVVISRHHLTDPLQVNVNTGEGDDLIVVNDRDTGLTINSGDQADEVIIYDAAFGTVVNTDAGDDVIELIVSDRQPWGTSNWIQVFAGMGDDTVRVRDDTFVPEEVTRFEYQIAAGEITRTGHGTEVGTAERLAYGDAEIVELFSSDIEDRIVVDAIRHAVIVDTGAGPDAVSIPSVPLAAWAVVRTGAGLDSVTIGNGNYLADIRGPITVNGGDDADADALLIDDREAAYIGESYALEATSFSKSGFFFLPPFEPISVQGPILSWEGIGQIRLDGSRIGSEYELRSVAPYVTVEVHGGNGNDHFVVGGGNFMDNIRGSLAIQGDDGENTLTIDDRADMARLFAIPGPLGDLVAGVRDIYELNATTFQKTEQRFVLGAPVTTSPLLSFGSMAAVIVEGSGSDGPEIPEGSSRFVVQSASVGTRIELHGNSGIDAFEIQSGHLGSGASIGVLGGDPAGTTVGDTLFVNGTRVDSGSYLPGSQRDNGRVTVNGHPIDFSGLEPVYVEGLGSFTFTTPRSRDLIDIREYPPRAFAGTPTWTEFSGTSGVLNTAVETLRVRDIGTLTAVFYAFDLLPEPPAGPFDPTDLVTIHPRALSGNRVDRLQVVMGIGGDRLIDRTLEGSRATTVLSTRFITPVTHEVSGVAARVELGSLRAFDADGELMHHVESTGPGGGRLILTDPQPLVEVRRENAQVTLSAGEAGRQGVQSSHSVTSWEFQTTAEGQFSLQLTGNSRLSVDAIMTPLPPEIRGAAGVDRLTVELDPFGEFVSDDILIREMDTFDRLSIKAPERPGFADHFDVDLNDRSQSIVELYQHPVLLPTLPMIRPRAVIESSEERGRPAVDLVGNGSDADSVWMAGPQPEPPRQRTIDAPVGLQFVELLVIVTPNGSFSPLEGGRTRAELLSEARTIPVESDTHLRHVTVDTGGTFSVEYEPDFRPIAINTVGTLDLQVRPRPDAIIAILRTAVTQELTPNSGTITAGNCTVTYDGAPSSIFVEASEVDVRITRDAMSDSFDRDLSLGYSYLGSEGKYIIKDVTFNGKFDMTVEHKAGVTNTTTIQQKDVVYEKTTTTKIIGADGGQDEVLVTKAGVETKEGSKLEVDLKTRNDFVAVTTTNSGPAEGKKDEILVKGTGVVSSTEEVKKILVHKQQDVTPEQQLGDLKAAKPEDAVKIQALQDKANQPLLAEKGTQKTEAGDTSVAYTGEKTKLDLFVKNVSPKALETTVMNSDGSSTIEKVGNVAVTVPELVGTGIDPDGQFSTCAVTNTYDSGPGSLREAIECANLAPSAATAVVSFAIGQGSPVFAEDFGTGSSTELVAADTTGNSYVLGFAPGALDLDGDPAREVLVPRGYFLVKYDPAGRVLWEVHQWSGTLAFNAIDVDDSGNILLGGQYLDTVDFDPGAGVHAATVTASSGFLLKLDSTGALAWVRTQQPYDPAATDRKRVDVRDVAVDAQGHAYVTGTFLSGIQFAADAGLGDTVNADAARDSYVAKYDAQGNLIWVNDLQNATANHLDVSPDGLVYTAGLIGAYFDIPENDTIADFDAANQYADNRDILITSRVPNWVRRDATDVFLLRCRPDGSFDWVRQLGAEFSEIVTDLAVDANGSITIAGAFNAPAWELVWGDVSFSWGPAMQPLPGQAGDMVDFDPGPSEHLLTTTSTYAEDFVLRLDREGEFLWARSIGSDRSILAFNPHESRYSSPSLAVDEIGEFVVARTVSRRYSLADAETIVLDAQLGGLSYTQRGISDLFLIGLNQAGSLRWTDSIAGSGASVFLPGLSQDGTGNLYLTGSVQGTADLDPGSGTRLQTDGSFFLKLTFCHLTDVDAQLPGGDPQGDVFVISPLSPLPALVRGNIVINGQSQQNVTGDSNPFGPEIVLAGHQAGLASGLELRSSGNRVHALNIQGFSGDGIRITAEPDAALNGVVDKSLFLQATGAQATAALENVGQIPGSFADTRYTTTDLQVAVSAFGMAVGALPGEGVVNDDWTLRLPGPEMAAAVEDFAFDLAFPAYAFGFDFVEPQFDPNVLADFIDSTFAVRLLSYGAEVGQFTFNAPNDAAAFIGAWSAIPFNRIEVRELVGDSDNEFFGRMYIGSQPPAADGNTVTGSYIGTNATGTADTAELPGMVGWWPGEGTAADIAGDYGGTLAGGTNFAPGIVGQAFSFDGVDDLVTTPLVVDYTGGVTFELWVQTTGDGGNCLLAGGGGATASRGMGLFLEPTGRPLLMGTKGTPGNPNFQIFPDLNIADGTFHHLAGTWTGDTTPGGVKLYLDGVLIGSATALTAIATDGTPLSLGDHPNFYLPFQGLIDEPAVYGRVLSASEIASIHSRGSVGKATSPANGGSGVHIANSGGNLIGGATESARNVISGNALHGVHIVGNGAASVPTGEVACRDLVTGAAIECASLLSGNTVAGNYIGTDASGMRPLGNVQNGVFIEDSGFNTVGGSGPVARNVIAANANGVAIVGAQAGSNQVAGNFIGVGRDGLTVLENQYGIAVVGDAGLGLGAPGNVIGGTTEAERNIISGNFLANVFLARTLGTTVQGNYIGTDWTGTRTLGGRDGIKLEDDRGSRIVGNVISGNTESGIEIIGKWVEGGTQGSRIFGNRIGTTADGRQSAWNRYGIIVSGHIDSDFDTHEIVDLAIGGTQPGEGNLISGNLNLGIWVYGPGAQNIRVQGNLIGTDIDGIDAVPNGLAGTGPGVLIDGASGVLVGGTEDGARNVISGNAGNGVTIVASPNPTTTQPFTNRTPASIGWTDFGNTSHRNAFGLSLTNHTGVDGELGEAGGTFARASTGLGELSSLPVAYYADPYLGGPLSLDDPLHAGGELIVTDMDQWNSNVLVGTFGRGDAESNLRRNFLGLGISEPSPHQGSSGIRASAYLGLADGTELLGSWVNGAAGLAPDTSYTWRYDYDPSGGAFGAGELVVEVLADGVSLGVSRIELTAAQRAIGGTFDAFGLHTGGYSPLGESPNTVTLYIDNVTYTRAIGNTIQGNYIGTDASGEFAIGNSKHGLLISGGASDNRVLDNVISGNASAGVVLADVNTTDNRIQGNFVGTDALGMTRVPNLDGIAISRASGNTIGGSAPGEGNLISGSARFGIDSSSLSGNTIQGNLIGTDANGQARLAVWNFHGIHLYSDVGTLVESNVIVGSGWGIWLGGLDGPTRDVLIQDNQIGTPDGVRPWGNASGIHVEGNNGHRVEDVLIGGQELGKGNLISGNELHGIVVTGEGARQIRIQGNRIGTKLDGLAALANGSGISIANASGVLVGGPAVSEGNVISGNLGSGVTISGGSSHTILGNFVGLDVSGQIALGNGGDGVTISESSGNLLRNNVISGHTYSGVYIAGASSTANLVEDNKIGTNASGLLDRGNLIMGVFVLQGSGNTVRGNLISGNDNYGVAVAANSNANFIDNNLIGTDSAGQASIGNTYGMSIAGNFNLIRGNVISGNLNDGVLIDGQDAGDGRGSGNVLQGNTIGMAAGGTAPLGNLSHGIRLWRGAGANLIGTDGDGVADDAEGNLIAHNGGDGVSIMHAGSQSNTIRRNSIHSNGGLGFDLSDDGVTPNDNGDAAAGIPPDLDSGPNSLQNFPDLRSAKPGLQTTVVGNLRSTPGAQFIIDVYANQEADPNGYGEGQRWLGSFEVTTDLSGAKGFNRTLDAATFGGEYLTATATRLVATGPDPSLPLVPGDTSEFSAALAISPGRGVRGPDRFSMTLPAADSQASAVLLTVQLAGVAAASAAGAAIDVDQFRTDILAATSGSGPIGLPFRLIADSGQTSPLLLRAAAEQQPRGTLELVGESTLDGVPFVFARWTFHNARISSYSTANSRTDGFTLDYDRLDYAYTPLSPRGVPLAPVTGTFDVLATGGRVGSELVELPASPALSSVDYLVHIPAIPGDVMQVGYEHWIEVRSFAFGLLAAESDAAPLATTFEFIADAGSHSPRLLDSLARGEVWTAPVEIVALYHGVTGPREMHHWTLDAASVASYATRSGLLDSFTLAFDTLHLTSFDYGPTSAPRPPVQATWDRVAAAGELISRGVDLDEHPLNSAGISFLVRVPGADGDSTRVGYVNWIRADEYRFIAERPVSGRHGSSPLATSFAFVAGASPASPRLLDFTATGQTLGGPVEIVNLQTVNNSTVERTRWTLAGPRITSFDTASATYDGFTAAFEDLCYALSPLDGAGRPLPAVVGQWNVLNTGTRFSDSPLALPNALLVGDASLLVNLPGITGAATLAGYVGWIDVGSFAFAASREGATALASTIQFAAASSKATPELLRALASDRALVGATVVAVRRNGSKVSEFARWSLRNVHVAAFATDNTWQDSFAISFDALTYAFTPAGSGKLPPPPVTTTWDLTATGARSFLGPLAQPAAQLPSNVRVLVQVPGVNGSSALQGYVDWIEVSSARLAAERADDRSSPNVTSFQFSGLSSLGSAQLLQAVADGRRFAGNAVQVVTVEVLRSGALHELARWTLRNAQVTGYATRDALHEQFSLGFDAMELAFTPLSGRGTPGPTIRASWDLPATGGVLLDNGVAGVTPTAPQADVTLLVHVPGIPGDSLRQGYLGWIEVDTFAFAIRQPWSAVATAASWLTLELPASLAAPHLFDHTAAGGLLPPVEVVAIRDQEPSVVFARLVLDGASLAAFGTADSKSDGLAIAFAGLQFTYYEQANYATALWPSTLLGDTEAEGEGTIQPAIVGRVQSAQTLPRPSETLRPTGLLTAGGPMEGLFALLAEDLATTAIRRTLPVASAQESTLT